MKVLAINGSARKNGNTAIAINAVLEPIIEEGIETEIIQLSGEKIRGCTACYKCKEKLNKRCVIENDIVNDIIQKLLNVDAVIFASPTYFADMTSELKAVIDRVGVVSRCNGNMLKRKIGAAVVVARRGGPIHTFDSINHFFFIQEMIVPGSNYWNTLIGGPVGAVESDEEGLATLRLLGDNIGWLLNKIK